MSSPYKIIIFDMDGTLLRDHFIYIYAARHGFLSPLMEIINSDRIPFQRSVAVASLLKGHDSRAMLSLFRTIPKQQHLTEVLQAARDNGMATAIVSASYQFLVDSLCADLGIPQGIANTLILQDHLATGEIHIHNQNHDTFNGKVFSIHKGKVLEDICKSHHIKPEEAIAIGDGPIDCSMLQCAGLGVAFNASEEVKAHSDLAITDFRELLPYITGRIG